MFKSDRMFSTIAVDDIKKARQFYGETLGLDVQDGEQPGLIQITVRAVLSTVGLSDEPPPPVARRS